jgi:hypothetical protein
MSLCENERRFKTAGARLPNSRKLPRGFFIKSKHNDENIPPSNLCDRLASIEPRRPSFDFTFMISNPKRNPSRESSRNKPESPVKLPLLKKSDSVFNMLKASNRRQWLHLESTLKQPERINEELVNRTLTRVNVSALSTHH